MGAPGPLIDESIEHAHTLPAEFYTEPKFLELIREQVFARSWQLATDTDRLKVPGQVLPCTLMEGFLDEPLLFTRDAEDRVHCLSNVCTHRGNLLVEGEGHAQALRCRYHGRRFGLDGCFQSAPGFEQARNFPSEADNLACVPFGQWDKFLFVSINPRVGLDQAIGPLRERLDWLPLREFVLDPALSRDYLVNANWALYCDNYLEGFHIPYVHPDLASRLDTRAYRTELFSYANVQIGIAAGSDLCFELPPSSPDFGQAVAGYYFWLFPNTMFNFYPWGLSVNIVTPLAPARTRVSFLSYVWDRSKLGRGAGAALDRVEREDEEIVEKVQKGIRSRFYERGRYSPQWEAGVHQFHRLLTRFLSEAGRESGNQDPSGSSSR